MVKHFKKKKTTQQVQTSIECDKCHKIYHEAEEEVIDGLNYITAENDMWEIDEFHHISFTGGYGSIFGDMDEVECDICQHCLKEMIGSFCRITPRY